MGSKTKVHFINIVISLCRYRLLLVEIPQLADEIRDHNVSGVLGNDPQDENTVIPQEFVGKGCAEPPVKFCLDFVVDLEVLPDIGGTVPLEDDAVYPHNEAETRDGGDQHEPEPDEDKDFFVEEVDRQDALHCPGLKVLQLPDAEVAERDSREARGLPPDRFRPEVGQNLEAVQVVVCG